MKQEKLIRNTAAALCALALMGALTGCSPKEADPSTPPTSGETSAQETVDYSAVVLRTSDSSFFTQQILSNPSNLEGVGLVTIGSTSELEQFRGSTTDERIQIGLSQYGESFFENNALLLVLWETNSGSVQQSVSFSRVGDTATVKIDTSMPEYGTNDMANWIVVVPVKGSMLQLDQILVDISGSVTTVPKPSAPNLEKY